MQHGAGGVLGMLDHASKEWTDPKILTMKALVDRIRFSRTSENKFEFKSANSVDNQGCRALGRMQGHRLT
jgi:hypothetical protein